MPILGEIPLDAQVRVSGDTGQPVVVAAPDSPAGQALIRMAKEVAARVSVTTLTEQSHASPLIIRLGASEKSISTRRSR